jgi:hypothetical protein
MASHIGGDAVPELKARLRELMDQRGAIEAEIAERTARLNAPGQPGLQGSLLDKEVRRARAVLRRRRRWAAAAALQRTRTHAHQKN